jgi:hypothetical protein
MRIPSPCITLGSCWAPEYTAPRLGHPLDASDHFLPFGAVLEGDLQRLLRALPLDLVAFDVTLALQRLEDLFLDARVRNPDTAAAEPVDVPDPGQQVSDRIGHAHCEISSSAFLPAGLLHAGDLAPGGEVPEADPAYGELPEVGARATAQLAAVVRPSGELGSPPLFQDQGLPCHVATPMPS